MVFISSYVTHELVKIFFKQRLTDFTRRSNNPPCQGALATLNCHKMHLLAAKFCTSELMNDVPLSDIINFGLPRREIDRFKTLIQDTPVKSVARSR